jgi:hypothetical protein
MGRLPRLRERVLVRLEPISRDESVNDEPFREPVGQPERQRTPAEFYARVVYGRADQPRAESGGAVEQTDGYIVVHTADLRRDDIDIQRGDKITQLGSKPNARTVELFITRSRPMAISSRANGASLMRFYFEDRERNSG